jgi:hypothetical protein
MSDPNCEATKTLLRHFLAALAYRTQKALRGAAPKSFADFQAGKDVRTPHELVCHMHSVLGYARARVLGGEFNAAALPDFEAEVQRLHHMMKSLANCIQNSELQEDTAKRLLQGPLSDAMTHAGQLAMLRRLAGIAIPPENFFNADITADHLGIDQPLPKSPGNRKG